MTRLRIAAGILVLMLGSACSGQSQPTSAQGSKVAVEAATTPTTAPADEGQAPDEGIVEVAQEDAAQPDAAPSINTQVKKSASKAKTLQPPQDFPYKTPVKVESSVEPMCAERGDTIELTVTTPPEAAIAYQAIYSNNKSGAGAPFGEGYGGNDKGYANASGEWTSSWIVATNAPVGRARVDVYVGFEGKWGTAHTRFAVADADGKCPQEWLKGEE